LLLFILHAQMITKNFLYSGRIQKEKVRGAGNILGKTDWTVPAKTEKLN
jgi:hypothetical protein